MSSEVNKTDGAIVQIIQLLGKDSRSADDAEFYFNFVCLHSFCDLQSIEQLRDFQVKISV